MLLIPHYLLFSLTPNDHHLTFIFFRIITELGSETFFIVVIPPIYWCINKKFGYRLLVITTLAAYITVIIKNITRLSRPSQSLLGTTYGTYSFPSGHAHGTTTFWLYLIQHYKKNWLLIVGVFIIGLVSISRIYLRVHYWSDVLVGIALGVATVVAFIVIEPRVRRMIQSSSFDQRLFMSVVIPLLLIIYAILQFDLDIQALKLSSALFGIFLGGTIEQEYLGFSENTSIPKKVFRTIFGLFLAYLAYFGLGTILPLNIASSMLTSFLGGFTVTFIAPWAFTKLEES